MNNMARPISVTVLFTPEEILYGDLSRFLSLFEPAKFSHGRALQGLMGCLDLIVDRSCRDGSRVPTLPEIAAFCRKLRTKFPYMGFFCSLDTPYYMLNCLCAVPSLTVARDNFGRVELQCSESDLYVLLQEEGFRIDEFCTIADVAPSKITKRVELVRAYLQGGVKPMR